MEDNYVLVFERLGRSLKEELGRREGTFNLDEIKQIGQQVLQQLGFIHRKGVIHTDLKLQNIMTEHEEREKVKVIDFGNAVYQNERGDYTISTRQFRAPEVILNQGWDQKADIWSIGCVLFQLATSSLLFPTHHNYHHLALIQQRLSTNIPPFMTKANLPQELIDLFQKGEGFKWPIYGTPHMKSTVDNTDTLKQALSKHHLQTQQLDTFHSLLIKMLQIDPSQRPSAYTLLTQPFLS